MRKYLLLTVPYGAVDYDFEIFECILFDGEDLTASDGEKKAGQLLRWLNERGCDYHIEKVVHTDEMFFFDRHHGGKHYYHIFIYDDDTAALMALFHPTFVEIIPPEVILQRENEAKAAELEEARIAAIRKAEDEAHAKAVARNKKRGVALVAVSSLDTPELEPSPKTVEDDASPPTRAFLENIIRFVFR